jgi:hypothetical protein
VNPIFLQLTIVVVGTSLSLVAHVIVIRWSYNWRKEQEAPLHISRKIENLSREIWDLTGQVRYLEGKVNGRSRPKGETP